MSDSVEYEIVVKERRRISKLTREWVVVSSEGGKSAYGYGPPIDRMQQEDVEIYSQTVRNLDVAALARFINQPRSFSETLVAKAHKP